MRLYIPETKCQAEKIDFFSKIRLDIGIWRGKIGAVLLFENFINFIGKEVIKMISSQTATEKERKEVIKMKTQVSQKLNLLVKNKDILRPLVNTKPEKDFKVLIDKDPLLNYETKRFLYFITLPLMWILTLWVIFKKKVLRLQPQINSFWFDGLSTTCRQIKEGAGSWRALDIIYNFQFGQEKGISGKISDYWVGMINAQAVRNRLSLAERELAKSIREFAQKEKKVRLLSIASGSAEAIIKVAAQAKKEGINVQATILDLDSRALDYAKKEFKRNGLKDDINFVRGRTSDLENIVKGEKPHIVEMVGFLDYRRHVKAVYLLKRIYDILLPGGVLITANISSNYEQSFLKHVINWSMVYRRPEELGKILAEGGFDPDNCKIIYEPHLVHAVAVCYKSAIYFSYRK